MNVFMCYRLQILETCFPVYYKQYERIEHTRRIFDQVSQL